MLGDDRPAGADISSRGSACGKSPALVLETLALRQQLGMSAEPADACGAAGRSLVLGSDFAGRGPPAAPFARRSSAHEGDPRERTPRLRDQTTLHQEHHRRRRGRDRCASDRVRSGDARPGRGHEGALVSPRVSLGPDEHHRERPDPLRHRLVARALEAHPGAGRHHQRRRHRRLLPEQVSRCITARSFSEGATCLAS